MQALKYAHLLLKYRPRSEYEIRERLIKRFFNKNEIEETITKLKNLNLIDDLNFAKFWINYRLTTNPKSKFYIENELKQKGLAKEIILRAVKDFDNFIDKETAYKLARKKLGSLISLDDPLAKKRRLYSYLKRRGYSYRIIKDIMVELLGEEQSEE